MFQLSFNKADLISPTVAPTLLHIQSSLPNRDILHGARIDMIIMMT